jgi:TolB-like protein
LFEAVWGNQIVSEDALTRCISDIRAELKKLSGRDDLIETLPKRGYRWTLAVRESDAMTDGEHEPSVGEESSSVAAPGQQRQLRRFVRHAARGLTYLLALGAMAVTGVWLVDQLSRPSLPVVAVLPLSAATAQNELAMRVENELTAQLMALGHVELLSRGAVDSRPENPFPFFFYEFGARWVLEGELQNLSERDVLTLAVVDARTGIVLMQRTEPIATVSGGIAGSISSALQALEPLIGSASPERR